MTFFEYLARGHYVNSFAGLRERNCCYPRITSHYMMRVRIWLSAPDIGLDCISRHLPGCQFNLFFALFLDTVLNLEFACAKLVTLILIIELETDQIYA
jgi:hypothetical protein